MASGTSSAAIHAIGVIGATGRLERCTEAFRRLWGASAGHPSEIERVLRSEIDRCTISISDVSFAVEAVTAAFGARYAFLSGVTLCTEKNALLAESLDESPAIVWLKDLGGRYLRVNERYLSHSETTADRLVGQSDADLPPRETIDGPRSHSDEEPGDEPLQLEYTIAPFERRPALAVVRFAVRDAAGDPIAVCGVAAPVRERGVVRAECARLMKIERWSRLDLEMVRAEALSEWGLSTEEVEPDPEVEPPTESPAVAAALAERDAALAANSGLERELGEGRRRVAALHEASATAARRAHELLAELTDERARREQLEPQLEAARERLAELESRGEGEESQESESDSELYELRAAVAQQRGRAEEAQAEVHALRVAAEQERARAEQADLQLQALSVREEDADAEVQAARARAEEADAEVQAARARAEEADVEMQAARAREEEADAEVQVARGRAQEADAHVQALRVWAGEAETEIQALRERAEQAEKQVQELSVREPRAETETQQLRDRVTRAEAAGNEFRVRAERAETIGHELRACAEQAETELQQLRDVEQRLTQELGVAQAALETARNELATTVSRIVELPAATRPTDDSSHDRPRWSATAQRALASTLASASEWRTGLKDSIKVLGVEGQWDSVCAWLPDERRPLLKCGAMWTAVEDRLNLFETSTWQRPQPVTGSELGRAVSAFGAIWVTDIETAEDGRMIAAFNAGMSSALLVPVRDGRSTIAVLELLTRSDGPPDPELAASIEAVALQLGHYWHLSQLSEQPRWRLGRL
jgi:hypothetical protein